MRIFWLMLVMNIVILFLGSILMPPLPLWIGGLIGIFVFLLVGNLTAKFVE
ncbi:MAG: hypothetical protein KJ915_06405 [Candidatus Omnitrophica bacterium]|nr:hypothetical protein [Candidatus Omnitrophota bacterium]